LWDTAGTDEYDQLRPLSYPDTHIFIIVFNLQSQDSLQHVEEKWVKEIEEHTKGIPFILVGNKLDMRKDKNDKKCVSTVQGEKVAKKIGASKYMECSAKTQESKIIFF
jgi:small GTP-binding protein